MSGDPRNRFDEWQQPEINDGELTQYNWVVHHPERLELHDYVDIGAFTVINAHSGVLIESGVQIGPHCDIHSRSTIDELEGSIIIREGAKVGSHSTLLPGVEIGRDSVIGSHSVVRDDIPADSLAVGTPAEIKNK